MWYDHGGGWGAGEWIAMSAMMVLFWGGLIALTVWIVHSVRPGHRADAAPPPPMSRADDVLAERYARGEIDDEEYARRRRVLHGEPKRR